jgi:hypothetical protein
VASWLRALADGYVLFDEDDLFRKVEGPVVVEEIEGQGDRGTRRQGDKETGGQGDKETRRQGDKLTITLSSPFSPNGG